MADEPQDTDRESDVGPKLPAEAGSPAGGHVRPQGDRSHPSSPAVEPRPPRMSRALRIGLAYLIVCLIAGVLLLLYSLRSVVTDLGNTSP